ncbi:hypothetical protein Y032_0005g2572 [Ancylostoma ceylanicum]|nr:hypothetical protein Y032_0005g2572 [Ancylostoma ceylanicum]
MIIAIMIGEIQAGSFLINTRYYSVERHMLKSCFSLVFPRPVGFLHLTRGMYEKKLLTMRREVADTKGVRYSRQLELAMMGMLSSEAGKILDDKIREEFQLAGVTAFCYLLLDPRKITDDVESLDLKKFVPAIFYVGKGTKARPLAHLIEAKKEREAKSPKVVSNVKLKRIDSIWEAGNGVLCLQINHSVSDDEAFVREAALIEAIRLENLTNVKCLKLSRHFGRLNPMSSSRGKRRGIRSAAREIVSKIPNSQNGLLLDLPSVSSVPAYECFAERISESSAIEKFEEDARVGDILIVKVKKCDVVGAYVKPLCFATRIKRDLEWLDIQLLTPLSALSRRVAVGQYLEARVSSVQPVKVELLEAPPLASNELPEYFRNGRDMPRHSRYWEFVENSGMLRNTYLAEALRLPTTSPYSFLNIEGLEKDRAEPASALRKRQNEMLAEEYVVRGVEQMRSGNRESAIVTLNQALEINPHCVEALVARGAAYSTNGHYALAEADFDQALALVPTHSNARNYMVETLVKHASL